MPFVTAVESATPARQDTPDIVPEEASSRCAEIELCGYVL